jgi:hypothetical protein
MAAAATSTVSFGVTGLDNGGSVLVSETDTLSTSVDCTKTKVALTTTPTALTIPSGTAEIYIQGVSGTTQNIVIGGAGVALANMATLHPTKKNFLSVPSSSPSVLIAIASGTGTADVYFVLGS